nr:zinc finger, CCHC-type [Tanacetum cinerariifolium]
HTVKFRHNKGTSVSQLEYSRAIECLMYAMISTRPDITFVVRKLSRYTSNPSALHWQALGRVFQYLKGTMDYGLTYSGYPSVIEGYSDASWINNMEDHSSTSGWVFLIGGGVISWASKKQTCITSSTIESKFVALVAAGNEAEWLRNLVYEIPLWPKPISTISIRCDSAATLAKAYSQVYNDLPHVIKEMGHEVVRQEDPEDPGKRTRLTDHRDVVRVLREYLGTDSVRSIHLDYTN